MERVISYVDGFNLYFGLKTSGFSRFLWLDVHALSVRLMNPARQSVVRTNYFTSRISDPPDKVLRQGTYIEALQSHRPELAVHLGKYQHTARTCPSCGHQQISHNEKMTDVNIACELLHDAFVDAFDVALVISADSDLSSPIQRIRSKFPTKRVLLGFPPNRKSKDLRALANGVIDIKDKHLRDCQMPATVRRSDGYALVRPPSWA